MSSDVALVLRCQLSSVDFTMLLVSLVFASFSWLVSLYVVPPYWVTTLAQVDALLKSVGFVVFVSIRHHLLSTSSFRRVVVVDVLCHCHVVVRPLVVPSSCRSLLCRSVPHVLASCLHRHVRRRRRRLRRRRLRCLGCRSSPSQRLRYISTSSVKKQSA